jgi:hypothetical protein
VQPNRTLRSSIDSRTQTHINSRSLPFSSSFPNMISILLLASWQISFLLSSKCSATSEYSFERLLPNTPTSSVYKQLALFFGQSYHLAQSASFLSLLPYVSEGKVTTYTQSNWTVSASPPSKMMVTVASSNHLCMHIATHAKF